MGTVFERPRKDKTIAYTAQISIMRDGEIYRETKTFDRKPAANAWVKKREKELEKPGALEAARGGRHKALDPQLSAAIDQYVADSTRDLGRTKAQVLRSIKDFDIAGKHCSEITSVDVVEFAKQKLAQGVMPQTVGNYLSHLGSIFSIARPAWGYPLDPMAMEDAWKVAKKLGIAKKSDQRERRPTLDELDKLMTHYVDRAKRKPDSTPMHLIIPFAIFSTRRQEEITRIVRPDFDEAHARVCVRDMKNPGEKIGNDVWCDLPPEAVQIILAMPDRGDHIFPYSTDAISASFTRTCQLLGIEDLHFHDLRHDGISRLFEMGWNIPHAAAVSGHRSWTSLKRYTHLRQTGDKYANWAWLKQILRTNSPPSDATESTALSQRRQYLYDD